MSVYKIVVLHKIVFVLQNASGAVETVFFFASGVYFFGGTIFILYGSAKLQKWNFHSSSFQYYIFEALNSMEPDFKIKTN